jgi:HAD superfamily hydrolase (TIGR01450 family)
MRDLLDYQGYIFDLDGTVYLGDQLIPGAERALAALRAAGKRVAFISNKSIGRAREYAEKLRRLGIAAEDEEVINSAVALRLYLEQAGRGRRVLLIGEEPVREELVRGGCEIVEDPARAEIVAVSWDRGTTYERLNAALQALRAGAHFVATNPDVTCPLPGGREALDAGSFIALLEAACGRPVEAVAGKPSPLLLEVIMDRWGLEAGECLLLGDRLETDLELGRRAGAAVAVVLTGVATRETLAAWPVQPDYVLESVGELAAGPGGAG